MSNYAEKHQHHAECADAHCPHDGVVLKVFRGKPDWFCVGHADAIDRIQKGKAG